MAPNPGWAIQEHPCRSRQKNPFTVLPRCLECHNVAANGRRRLPAAQVNCRFKGLRIAQFAPDKSVVAVGFRGEFDLEGHPDRDSNAPDRGNNEQSTGSSRHTNPQTLCALSKPPQSTSPPLHFPHVYNRPLDPDVVAFIKGTCAKFLLPIMRQELSHTAQEGIVFLTQEIQYRSLCDVCASELFGGAWFCSSCALEVCHLCAEALTSFSDLHPNLLPFTSCRTGKTIHSITTMRPCSRLAQGVSQFSIGSMTLAAEATIAPYFRIQPPPLPSSQRIPDGVQIEHKYAPQTLPVYPAGDLSRNQFLSIWAAGIPVVMTQAQKKFQGHWDPSYFIAHYGKLWVTPIDCETDQEVPRMTASKFFALLLTRSEQQATLKLKDWPPKADFKTTFGKLDYAFFRSVPVECADMVCKGGIYNLAAHFPEGAVAPDLGPKLYIAMGAKGVTNGTTKLHLDVTCAINIMMWSEDTTSQRPGAEWQIFSADSVENLRNFLREEFSLSADEDPIHQQHYYLSHAMLTRLRERHGVSPWTIYQYYGDVVFIPAGCPHQVRNLTHAIKAACDFVSPQNLHRTIDLAASLRTHRIVSGSGEDLLQLQALVWFGWMAMSTYEAGQASLDAGAAESSGQGAAFIPGIQSSTRSESLSCAATSSSDAPLNRKRGLSLTPSQMKRARKKARILPNPGCHIMCPFSDTCSLGKRLRSVLGTLDHLRDSHHKAYQKIDDPSLKELRDSDDNQFVKKLKVLLGLPKEWTAA